MSETPNDADEAPATMPLRLLYVEDHASFARIAVAHLLTGHTVTVAATLADARSLLAREWFDAVLIDYDLPDGKGDALLPILRALPDPPSVIAASSHADGNAALLSAGADAVCAKPEFDRIGAVLAGLTPAFGTREPGQTYTPRPGSYAVPFDDAGRVGVARLPHGLYLPGGGIDPGETPEAALRREVREELGYAVAALRRLPGGATEYLRTVTGARFVKECVFFAVTLGERVGPGEADHELVWLSADEAAATLRDGSQRWAVRRALAAPTDAVE